MIFKNRETKDACLNKPILMSSILDSIHLMNLT